MTIREQLDANIPRDAISTRSQSGKSLSYLEGWYVIDRLNQVLGTENWGWYIEEIITVPGDKISYIIHGKISAMVNGAIVYKTGLGYGSDKGNFNPGEMAIKEAETDALKRAAMKLGRSLGLALYDKTQEYVDDERSDSMDKNTDKAGESVPTNSTRRDDKRSKASTPARSGAVDSKVLKGQIKNAFAVLQAQKKITKEDFVKDYTAGVKVDDLAESAVLQVLNKLKQNYPDLGL